MFCALSGEPPEVPVVSSKSGALFEKRLIEAYVEANGRDPVSGDALALEDLIPVKGTSLVRPRPQTATSLPALLSLFQNEWDAITLESFTLRQQLAQTRQELSTALYQHDAACRVIARVIQERDEARAALQNVQAQLGSDQAMAVDTKAGNELPANLIHLIDETQQRLSASRRKRKVQEGWATSEEIKRMQPTPLIPATGEVRGAFALQAESRMVLSEVSVYSLLSTGGEPVSTLAADAEEVSAAAWAGDLLVTGEADGAVKVYDKAGQQVAQLASHGAKVTAVAVHPSLSLVATASLDRGYAVHDMAAMATVTKGAGDSELSAAAYHPDGHLLAVGTDDASIAFYDTRTQALEATFGPHSGPVTSIAFSENGYWVAAAAQEDATLRIWDLRKASVAHELPLAGGGTETIAWDASAQFLAVGGSAGVRVFEYVRASKSFTLLRDEPELAAEGLAWTEGAHSLVVRGLDGGVRLLTQGE